MAIYQSPVLRSKTITEIAQLMGVKEPEVRDIFYLLKERGVLVQGENADYKIVEGLVFDSHGPQQSLRQFHSVMINKALIALENQTNEEKFIGSETFSFDEESMPHAREIIDDFLNRMVALSKKSQGKYIYHLGTQFFKVTH